MQLKTLEDWLDDLCVRFILNVPAEELRSLERICFQIEEAQWFYEDFIRPLDPSLPSLNLKPFFQRITPRCPVLQNWAPQEMVTAYERFLQYKQRVPVRGVILLNESMDEVVLVKGWKKNGTWSFPRGKINKDESDLDCAIREAWEETGYDLRAAGLVKDPKKIKHIEKTIRAQSMKLFVFRGVPRDANFVPQTRKEISKVEWFKLGDLPMEKRKAPQEGTGQHLVANTNKFYVVAPFVIDLRKIINAERRKDNRQSSRAAATSTIPTPEMHIPILPMSPAIPSSLPEVTVAHSNPMPNIQTQSDSAAKSNALLALLRGGPTEMHTDPHIPQEPPQFVNPQMSPERNSYLYPGMHIQSPPAISDLHQQMHPAAPPSSALPQLSQHTRSLLDAFKQPPIQSPPPRNITPAKQNLLAAFGAPSAVPAVSPQPPVVLPNQNIDLHSLLQRASPNSDKSKRQQPAPQQPVMQEQAYVNPLMSLLKTQKPAESLQVVAPAPTPAQPVELSATSVSASETKAQAPQQPKEALLSLLRGPPKSEAPTNVQLKTRSGTTSATLDRPIDQPQFDAISRAPTLKEETSRPTAGEKKLFDHKTGSVRAVPPKPITVALPKLDDRSKAQKSPRNARQQKQQVNSPGRKPSAPKEPPKPFQPQILKRSQLAEPNDLSNLLPLKQKEEEESEDDAPGSAPIVAPATAAGPKLSLPLFMDSAPLSPSLSAPQAVLEEYDPIYRPDMYPPQRSSQVISPPVPDPQRESLLALLKTPVKSPSPISPPLDADATPKAPAVSMHPQISIDDVVTAPPPSQVISPIQEPEAVGSLPRSRVSSLASTGNGVISTKATLEKRQTAGPEKAFLMQYLKGLTSQETM